MRQFNYSLSVRRTVPPEVAYTLFFISSFIFFSDSMSLPNSTLKSYFFLYFIQLFLSVFTVIINRFIHSFLRFFNISIDNCYLLVLVCTSATLHLCLLSVLGFLAAGGDTLSWLFWLAFLWLEDLIIWS